MPERDVLEVDVLYVGAGPANLASALRLTQLIKEHNAAIEAGQKTGEKLSPMIVILEKALNLGAHTLSGAVMDPKAINELLPGWEKMNPPAFQDVKQDEFHLMLPSGSIKAPINPPFLNNHGNKIISLGEYVKWLGDLVQKEGIDLFLGIPGSDILYEGDRVIGVRTGDKGIDKTGQQKPNFEPGIDIKAKVTVLGEGPRGSLTKKLVSNLKLDGRHEQNYATGVKEVWKIPNDVYEPGKVIHTLGYPLDAHTFGGGFIYHAANNLLYLGFVTGLDYRNPRTDPHEIFQKFKQHPLVKRLIEKGEILCYGAKSIPEGGYYAQPQYAIDGCLIVGDSASFLNSQRLKGIHLGMKSGMLAAETIFEALLKKDTSKAVLKSFRDRVESSWIKPELWKVRNFHQPYQKYGLIGGMIHTGLQYLTNGRGLIDPFPSKPDDKTYEFKKGDFPPAPAYDAHLTFTKVGDLFFSGTKHDEDQPAHLKVADLNICEDRCAKEYGNPCQYFCPANVYEMVAKEGREGKRLQINFSNCVHCKTCDIADPYRIITWTTPEGGGGPNYVGM